MGTKHFQDPLLCSRNKRKVLSQRNFMYNTKEMNGVSNSISYIMDISLSGTSFSDLYSVGPPSILIEAGILD